MVAQSLYIPNQMYSPVYRGVSCEARLLFSMLFNNATCADTKEKFDSSGYSCVKMSGAEIAVELNCHIQKARKTLKELVKAELVEVKKKPGQTRLQLILTRMTMILISAMRMN